MRRKTVSTHQSPRIARLPSLLAKIFLPTMLPLSSFSAWAQVQSPVQNVVVVGNSGADQKKPPTIIQAEQISGRPERYIQFDDQVEVVNGPTTMYADKAIYHNLEDTLDASGHVVVKHSGDCYTGDNLSMQLESNIGFVTNPVYKLLRNNAQGKAERIEFESDERSTIRNGTYSTCEGLDPDWYLKMDTLKLDTGLDVGVAKKAVVYFKGVPILPSLPWLPLSFPLSGARQSGFLPPTINLSNGVEIGIPYYFNIAPNRDLTVVPNFIQKRGLQLGLDGRYKGLSYAGETSIEALFNDKITGTNRYAITSSHQQNILPQWLLTWNINIASDDNYAMDFSKSITKTAEHVLPREINNMYFGSFWNLGVLVSNYQILQDPAVPSYRQYSRLPQLTFHAAKQDVMGLDWALDSSFTRFRKPDLFHDGFNESYVQGDRLVLNPQISAPFIRPAFFVVPKMSWHATSYQLSNVNAGGSTSIQRTLPTFSVDTGLVFERPTKLFDMDLTQTLEPRLFYVKTPYRDQDKLPIFDSAPAEFNFAQIFNENRFTGQDRIGDANQITAALTSRYIQDTGEERMKFAIGQRIYFNTQKVGTDMIGATQSRSNLLLAASGNLSSNLSFDASKQISQSDGQSVNSNYGLSWHPGEKRIFNAQYRYLRDVLKQLDFSAQWPLADISKAASRWYMVGRSNYSLIDNKLVDGLVGFEYKADCWSLRMVAQRYATTATTTSKSFSIQLELNGLSRGFGAGTNPIEILKRNISGYQSGR